VGQIDKDKVEISHLKQEIQALWLQIDENYNREISLKAQIEEFGGKQGAQHSAQEQRIQNL